ncbi:hypothetical protein Q8F55_006074 [Vanrija albida]|uniref:BTB domain-containing protein n=1 Tax=Vanrija albida TaxID=181172 RepID=A0ABR3Q3D7_9TREE
MSNPVQPAVLSNAAQSAVPLNAAQPAVPPPDYDAAGRVNALTFHADFNQADNPVILQAMDDTCYRFDSVLLRASSSWFRDIITLPLQGAAREQLIPFPTTSSATMWFTLSLLRDHFNPASRTTLRWPAPDSVESIIDFIRAYSILPAAEAFFNRSSRAEVHYQCFQRLVFGAVAGLPAERLQEACDKTIFLDLDRQAPRANAHLERYPAVVAALFGTHLQWQTRKKEWETAIYGSLANDSFLGPYREGVLNDFTFRIVRHIDQVMQSSPAEVINIVNEIVPHHFQQVRDLLVGEILRLRDRVTRTYGIMPRVNKDPEHYRLTSL